MEKEPNPEGVRGRSDPEVSVDSDEGGSVLPDEGRPTCGGSEVSQLGSSGPQRSPAEAGTTNADQMSLVTSTSTRSNQKGKLSEEEVTKIVVETLRKEVLPEHKDWLAKDQEHDQDHEHDKGENRVATSAVAGPLAGGLAPPVAHRTPDLHLRRAYGGQAEPPSAHARMGGAEVPATRREAIPVPTRLETIPARMVNEFVYCPRLFFYEHVEGIFVENADTLRGSALHKKVDSGSGALPPAKKEGIASPEQVSQSPAATHVGPAEAGTTSEEQVSLVTSTATKSKEGEPEVIHSRSVNLGSDRLGVTAKLDLIESRKDANDLFAAVEVCPVDYKAGSPKAGVDENELWDTDKMQLGLQCLILRDNGYTCNEGIIYYRGTKQRVRLTITDQLERWIVEKVQQAREVTRGPIPAPLIDSPKCARCSLVTICLPDETRMLALTLAPTEECRGTSPGSSPGAESRLLTPALSLVEEEREKTKSPDVRRLIAARDDRRALYLNTPGLYVGRSDEVLRIKDKEKVIEEIRVNDVCHIGLFGNIQISTQTIQLLCEKEVPVTYFSMGGWFYGMTHGHVLKNVLTRVAQFRRADEREFCLRLARAFVQGKVRNHRTLLMRNHLEPPAPALARLKNAIETCGEAADLGELLGMEGSAAALYFENFSGMIKVEEAGDPPMGQGQQLRFNFQFDHRNRRPPTDPVNALLSLAYSLLAKDCTVAAQAVGLDPYIGFFHQPRFGRPALALDVMEEFRPLIAESTVLNAINNRMITEKDFVTAGKAVNLTTAGRRQFFQAYEKRMCSLVTHPVFDYKVSYRRALELQFRILARVLTGEIPEYIPFVTR